MVRAAADRESREAAEKVAAERAARQERQLSELMGRLAGLPSLQNVEEQEDGQVQAAPVTGGEVENPAPSTSQRLHRAERGVSVEVGSQGDRSGESGQDRDYGLHGESTIAHESRRSFGVAPMKIAPPKLTDKKGFQAFQQQVAVFARYHDFESVLLNEPYINVGGPTSREEFLRTGVLPETYERHLKAWVYLSTAFDSPTDIGRFRRSLSPGQFWKEKVEHYCPTHAGNQIELRRQFTNFKIPQKCDPLEKLYELEDLAELMRWANIEVDTQTVLGTFVAALPERYDFEIRELSRKQAFDRDEVMTVIRAQYNLLCTKEKDPSAGNHHALAADERGRARGGRSGGKRGGRGGRGGGRGGNGNSNPENSGGENTAAGDGDGSSKGSMCYNCHRRGHFDRDCTVEVCKRCGGRGHDESKCPSAPDEKCSTALLAHLIVELPTADDLADVTLSEEEAGF